MPTQSYHRNNSYSVVGERRYDIHIIGQDSRSIYPIYPIVQQKIKKKKKKKSAGEKKKNLNAKKEKKRKIKVWVSSNNIP